MFPWTLTFSNLATSRQPYNELVSHCSKLYSTDCRITRVGYWSLLRKLQFNPQNSALLDTQLNFTVRFGKAQVPTLFSGLLLRLSLSLFGSPSKSFCPKFVMILKPLASGAKLSPIRRVQEIIVACGVTYQNRKRCRTRPTNFGGGA